MGKPHTHLVSEVFLYGSSVRGMEKHRRTEACSSQSHRLILIQLYGLYTCEYQEVGSLGVILEDGYHVQLPLYSLHCKYLSSYWSTAISIQSCFYRKRKLPWLYIPLHLPLNLIAKSHHQTSRDLMITTVTTPQHFSFIL